MKIDLEAHVAARAGGWGVRIAKRGCVAVWAGQGWKEGDAVPHGAMATMQNGFTWALASDAEQYIRTMKFKGEDR